MIGWIHASRGFLAKKWMAVAATSYDASGKTTIRPDGTTKLTQVIRALYRLMAEIWAGRNSALHNSDRTAGPLSLIDAEIVRYHRDPQSLLKDDRFYCDQSVNRLLTSSASIKRRWLHCVKQSRDRKATLDRAQPRITRFFSRDSRQTHETHHHGRPLEQLQQNLHQPNARTTTVQRLMTFFLHERASNANAQPTLSPSPSTALHD